MGRVIAIANQKGGVGKTTTAVNLSASLVELGQSVLLIDLDPQGNATMGSGVDKHALKHSLNEVLLGDCSAETACMRVPMGFDVLPGNSDLTVAEVNLMAKIGRETVLAQALKPIQNQYDYILMDCPPSLNTLTLNALVAAHSILIPMQCEYYALEGLADLLSTIEQVKASVNPNLAIEGVVRTLYDGRNRLSLDVSNELATHFGAQLYRTVIPRNVRLAEAPSHGMPALQYDNTSTGALAYKVLAAELMGRMEESVVKEEVVV